MQSTITQKPWGNYREFIHQKEATVKILTVNPGEAFSLQLHHKREEFWHVLSGDPEITVGDKTAKAKPGDEFLVGKEVKHRIAGGSQVAQILEIGFGDFDETDIVRLEDKYGRQGTTT